LVANEPALDEASLSDLIASDPALASRVIAASNTLAFNPWGVPIAHVPESVQIVGLVAVRDLAIALLLHELSEAAWTTPERQQAASLALGSGLLARAAAESVDPALGEQVLVNALLTSYGRLLLSSVLGKSYSEGRSDLRGPGVDDRLERSLGISPCLFGRTLHGTRALPRMLGEALRGIRRETVRSATVRPDPHVTAFAELGIEMGLAVDSAEDSAELEADLDLTIRNHSVSMGWVLPETRTLLQSAEERWKALNLALGVSHTGSPLARKISGFLHGDAAAPAVAVEPLQQPVGSTRVAEPSTRRIESCLASLTALMAQRGTELAALAVEFARCVHETIDAAESVVLLRNHSNERFCVAGGLGSLHLDLHGQPLLGSSVRDIFTVSLNRAEDVVIEDASAPILSPFIPAWMRSHIRRRSLVILPLADGNLVYGVVALLGPSGVRIQLGGDLRTQLRSLRTHVAEARRRLANPD
jgi:HD-like signal output (HDOD) protein